MGQGVKQLGANISPGVRRTFGQIGTHSLRDSSVVDGRMSRRTVCDTGWRNGIRCPALDANSAVLSDYLYWSSAANLWVQSGSTNVGACHLLLHSVYVSYFYLLPRSKNLA